MLARLRGNRSWAWEGVRHEISSRSHPKRGGEYLHWRGEVLMLCNRRHFKLVAIVSAGVVMIAGCADEQPTASAPPAHGVHSAVGGGVANNAGTPNSSPTQGPNPGSGCAVVSLEVHLSPSHSRRHACIYRGGHVKVYLDRDSIYRWLRVHDARSVCSLVRMHHLFGSKHSAVLACDHSGIDTFSALAVPTDSSGGPPSINARLQIRVRNR